MTDCTSFKSKSVFLPTALAVLLTTSGGIPVRAADAVTPGESVVERPTLICLGFQWYVEGDDNRNATVKVEYRVKGGDAWKQALPLLRIKGEKVGLGKGHGGLLRDAFYTCPNMFAGSIFDLQPGTEYECRLTLADPDGVQAEAVKTLTLRTRPEPTLPTGGRVRHVFPGGKAPEGFHLKEGERVCGSLVEALIGTHGGIEGYAGWATRTVWDQVKPGDVILIHKGAYNINPEFSRAAVHVAGQGHVVCHKHQRRLCRQGSGLGRDRVRQTTASLRTEVNIAPAGKQITDSIRPRPDSLACASG